ncbi:MAG: hypothetical protein IT361_00875 [Gemmatimonadaceae bacterium]|nr:hypothetical protein [Gemmatimonadaceae bacterium]
MKRLAFAASMLVLAACAKKEEAPAVDSAAPAVAPAPVDTAMKMDSGMKMDSAAPAADSATKH